MQNSNSKQLLAKPALATYYEFAHFQVLGRHCYIRDTEYATFEVFMDDLRELGIGYRDYAYGIVTILKSWMDKKKFYRIPIHVFCGDWALSKFRTVDTSQYVTIDEPEDDIKVEILESELLVARTYVDNNLSRVCRMREVIKDLEPLLSKRWLECSLEEKPVSQVIDILCSEYGLPYARDYNDIIRRVQCRK